MSEYKLPDVGEGLTEAEIVTWRVAVGDTVNVNDILVDIETAKSVVELPSPYAGVVDAILVEERVPEREPTLVGYGARTSGPRRRRKVPAHVGTVVQLRSADEHTERRVRV